MCGCLCGRDGVVSGGCIVTVSIDFVCKDMSTTKIFLIAYPLSLHDASSDLLKLCPAPEGTSRVPTLLVGG